MIDAVKAIPETIKNWRENREQLYNLLGCVAAVLVIVALATGSRPTESLAAVARGAGLASVADWLTVSAPPFLAVHVEELATASLAAAALLFAGMVIVPLVRGRHDDSRMFGYEFLSLIGSPAAATCWVLLAISAQHGDPAPALIHWAETAAWVALWTAVVCAAAGLLYLLASRYGLADFLGMLLRPVRSLLVRVAYGLVFAMIAIVTAGGAIPLSIATWVSGLESDSGRKIRAKIASERAEREQPTGAVISRLVQPAAFTPSGTAATRLP